MDKSNLPLWQCHKKVRAIKITGIIPGSNFGDPLKYLLIMENSSVTNLNNGSVAFSGIIVDQAYVDKHKPQIGGYYVLYPEDGYESFSPAKAFENGYTLITEDINS